ncbi:MAG: M15 family metallopeptidase [Bacteriovoracaceae bacterium]|nr:M15 family metallopeptidase [Bacteriovoracaceae bacterium]
MSKSNFDYQTLTGRGNKALVQWNESVLMDPLAKQELIALREQAQKQGIVIEAASGFRDYDKQLAIWNAKASGKRKILDRQENEVDFNNTSEKDILEAIMTWSAIPGASRHHWGTEVDIYDSAVKSRDKLQLTRHECNTEFKRLYNWINSNLEHFNFHRPYEKDLGGVSCEPWHLSYTPLSQQYQQAYTLDVFIRNIEQSQMLLKKFILDNAEDIYNRYIINITPAA